MLVALLVSYMKLRYGLFVIFISLTIAIFAAITINLDEVGLGHDDGIYVVLGKALHEGMGLRLINLPSSPYQVKYPIVYPFLISCIWQMEEFPQNIFWIKLMNVIFLFLGLLATCYISFTLLDGSKVLSVLVILLVGTSYPVLFFSRNTFSEIPYLFFSLYAVLLFLHAQGQGDNRKRYLLYFLAILCASLAYQTRIFGLSMLLAFVLYFLIKRQNKMAVFALFLISALNLPWIIWTRAHTVGPDTNPLLHFYTGYSLPSSGLTSYFELIARLKVVFLGNISYLYEYTSEILSNISNIFTPLRWFVWAILLVGTWKSLQDRRRLFIHLYLAVYVLIYLCLPTPTSRVRYLVPLSPFLFTIFFMGIMAIHCELKRLVRSARPRFYFIALVILLLLPNFGVGIRVGYNAREEYRPYRDGFWETISWIKEHTSKDAILACSYDPVYYLYTGRVALRPWFENPETYYLPSPKEARPFVGDPEYSFGLLKKLKVRYLIQEPLGGPEKEPVRKFFSDMIKKHGSDLELVFVSKDQIHRIYRMNSAQTNSKDASSPRF